MAYIGYQVLFQGQCVCVCISYKSYELCVIETSILYIWKLRAWKLSWAIKDLELLRG